MRRTNRSKTNLRHVPKKNPADLLYNINCKPMEYVGCTNVDRYFDIERVEREELVEIELEVKISKPVVVERGLKSGYRMFSSLSHNGVLAIFYFEFESGSQLTDLVNERQIEIKVKHWTHIGFYDDSMVVLTWNEQLGVCSVEDMFLEKDVSVLKRIGDVEVYPCTDVSLLHSTRTLLFTSILHDPYEFDVDTGTISDLDIEMGIDSFASLTGINVNIRGLFQEYGCDNSTFSLNRGNSTTIVTAYYPNCSIAIFIPSSFFPKYLKRGMKIYFNGTFNTNNPKRSKLTAPFEYRDFQSIVRLYQNIFLAFDAKTNKWCLVKIIVP